MLGLCSIELNMLTLYDARDISRENLNTLEIDILEGKDSNRIFQTNAELLGLRQWCCQLSICKSILNCSDIELFFT